MKLYFKGNKDISLEIEELINGRKKTPPLNEDHLDESIFKQKAYRLDVERRVNQAKYFDKRRIKKQEFQSPNKIKKPNNRDKNITNQVINSMQKNGDLLSSTPAQLEEIDMRDLGNDYSNGDVEMNEVIDKIENIKIENDIKFNEINNTY